MIVRVLGALGIGALAMYFFDPVSGRRRRALLRAQLARAQREIGDYAEGTAKELRGLVQRRIGQRRQAPAVEVDLSQ